MESKANEPRSISINFPDGSAFLVMRTIMNGEWGEFWGACHPQGIFPNEATRLQKRLKEGHATAEEKKTYRKMLAELRAPSKKEGARAKAGKDKGNEKQT